MISGWDYLNGTIFYVVIIFTCCSFGPYDTLTSTVSGLSITTIYWLLIGIGRSSETTTGFLRTQAYFSGITYVCWSTTWASWISMKCSTDFSSTTLLMMTFYFSISTICNSGYLKTIVSLGILTISFSIWITGVWTSWICNFYTMISTGFSFSTRCTSILTTGCE